jgi:hypothetical protein
MADITLYTQKKVGAGLSTVNVCRVKDADGLHVVSEVAAWEYPIDPATSLILVNYGQFSPVSGKADLLLNVAGQAIDLAKCKWAVALVVSRPDETTIYWLHDGLCSAIEPAADQAEARAKIEEQCCPDGYDLPPLITC